MQDLQQKNQKNFRFQNPRIFTKTIQKIGLLWYNVRKGQSQVFRETTPENRRFFGALPVAAVGLPPFSIPLNLFRSQPIMKKFVYNTLNRYGKDILNSENYKKSRTFTQHGNFSVWRHSLNVAETSLWISRALPLRFHERELVRDRKSVV